MGRERETGNVCKRKKKWGLRERWSPPHLPVPPPPRGREAPGGQSVPNARRSPGADPTHPRDRTAFHFSLFPFLSKSEGEIGA